MKSLIPLMITALALSGAAATAPQEGSPAAQDTATVETARREAAETSPLPTPDPTLVHAMRLDYVVAVSFSGQDFIIGMTRTIEPKMTGGRSIWRVKSEQKSMMGSATDTFDIDRRTFLPVYYSVTQGKNRIFLHFDATGVSGRIMMPEGEMPIALNFDEPFFGEAGAIEVTIPALPLAEGYATTFRIFEWLTQRSRPMRLAVEGTETITVPAGTFDAFKLTMEPLDGEPGGATLYVAEKEPRCVVQATFPIPPQFGGGSLTERLAELGLIEADQ